MKRIRNDLRQWKTEFKQELDVETLDINVVDGYVGDGYAIASAEIFKLIHKVARLEGLILDPVYTGKAFHGMIEKIRLGHFDGATDIVFLHTGGIFGLFPQRELLFQEWMLGIQLFVMR